MVPWKALAQMITRSVIILVGLKLLAVAMDWLRPKYYPDGLNGNLVLCIILLILMGTAAAFFGWAFAPLQDWWEETTERRRRELSDIDD